MAFQLFPAQPPVSLTPLTPLRLLWKLIRSFGKEFQAAMPAAGDWHPSCHKNWKKKPQGGATPAPALENCIPWLEKHFQRFYLAPGAVPGIRAPRERVQLAAVFLSQNHVTEIVPGISPWLLVGEGEGGTWSPEHGVMEGLLEKF